MTVTPAGGDEGIRKMQSAPWRAAASGGRKTVPAGKTEKRVK